MTHVLVEVGKSSSNAMVNNGQNTINNITIIGTGKVATFWTNLLQNHKIYRLFCSGSTQEKTEEFSKLHGVTSNFNLNSFESDLILVCVQDRNIENVVKTIPKGTITLICSGTYSIQAHTENIGIVYPLQSMNEEIDTKIDHVYFLTELNDSIRNKVESWLHTIDAKWSMASEIDRINAHLCAVIVNNFTYYILETGLDEIRKRNLSIDWFKPLIKRTFENAMLQQDLQTGPAQRGDIQTIKKHISLLEGESKDLYEILSSKIAKKYNHEL